MDIQATTLSRRSADQSGPLNQVYRCIEPPMAEVETLLASQMHSEFEELQELFAHSALLGGKRLRPALVFLSGQACGVLNKEHVTTAAVMEMIHTATLIHDDVLDGADQRRHVQTINARWDSQRSILLGDYLFAQAFSLSATNGSTDLCREIGDAARKVCEGEMRQCSAQERLTLSEEEYIGILRGKTAELCRLCCRLGALHSGASERVQNALATYGEALGIAFQIADDWLDIWGDGSQVGKTLGTDLGQGKLTLPLIRLLKSNPNSEAEIRRVIEAPESRSDTILDLLQRSDAESYTVDRARAYMDAAIKALDELEVSESREMLSLLAEFSVNRSF